MEIEQKADTSFAVIILKMIIWEIQSKEIQYELEKNFHRKMLEDQELKR